MVPPAEPRSYYGRPVIKEPVWTPEVPIYFFTGGLAGASAGLAFMARLTGRKKLARAATGNALPLASMPRCNLRRGGGGGNPPPGEVGGGAESRRGPGGKARGG